MNKDVNEFYVYASITAKSFFESHGYAEVRENTVAYAHVKLINYEMNKKVKR